MLVTPLPTDRAPLLQGKLPPLRGAPWSSPEGVVEGGTVEPLFYHWEPLAEFFKHFTCYRAGGHFQQDDADALTAPHVTGSILTNAGTHRDPQSS